MNDTPNDQGREPGWATAKTLAEALPFIQIYDRETVVIKYGGHAMGQEAVARQFAADVVLLKLMGVHPVVVHGGGPQISAMLERAGVKSTFVDGLRVTDPDSQIEAVVDLGFVGEPTAVDPQLVEALLHAEQDYVPVIAPIGVAEDGE